MHTGPSEKTSSVRLEEFSNPPPNEFENVSSVRRHVRVGVGVHILQNRSCEELTLIIGE